MTINMRCQDKERLVSYLYDEHTDAERDAVEAHLARCRDCSDELAELGGVRQHLAAWRTPEIDLGFRVVRESLAAAGRPSRWRVPTWAAWPAAAVLALAVGAAIANVELRYDTGGVTIRTGWSRGAPPVVRPAATTGASTQAVSRVPRSAGMTDEAWRSALADTERRLREEFTRTRAAATADASGVTAPSPDRADLVRQVRALIEESERRQQRELALRLAQVVQDVETQRRADLVQIEQNLGQIEGLTAAQRDMMQYLVRVSEGQ
jgi:hypothetical protein